MAAWHECVFPCVCTLLSCAFAEPDASPVEAAREGQQPNQPGMERTDITPDAPAGRIVGGIAGRQAEEPPPPNPYALFGENDRIDFRNRMRRLIMDIAAYAKRTQPGFAVMVENGLDLMTRDGTLKTDSQRDFAESIDGVLVEGLFGPEIDIVTRQNRLTMIERHRVDHWAVLASDRVTTPEQVAGPMREFASRGYLGVVAPPDVSPAMPVPDLRSRPVNENSKNIMSLEDVQNYLNLFDASGFKNQGAMIERLASTNYDMLVVPLHHPTDRYLSRADVRDLRIKRLGAQRAVVGRIALPVAEIGAYYWQAAWTERRPRWIQETGDQPGTLNTRYWTPQWRQILYGTPRSLIDGMISIGLNGVVLDTANVHSDYERQQAQEERDLGVRNRASTSDRTIELLQQLRR